MATLEQRAREYAAAHPRRVDDRTGAITTWNLWCASLIYRFTGSTRSYDTATEAGDAATLISADPSKAPIGAVHYWHDPANHSNPGHVAIDVAGRGRRLFMASAKCTEFLGARANAIGFCAQGDYKTTLTYRGWGLTYGSNKMNVAGGATDVGTFGAGAAGTGHGALLIGEEMDFLVNRGGHWFRFGAGRVRHLDTRGLAFCRKLGLPEYGDADGDKSEADFVDAIIQSELSPYFSRDEVLALASVAATAPQSLFSPALYGGATSTVKLNAAAIAAVLTPLLAPLVTEAELHDALGKLDITIG